MAERAGVDMLLLENGRGEIGRLEREQVPALHAHDPRDGGGRAAQGAAAEAQPCGLGG